MGGAGGREGGEGGIDNLLRMCCLQDLLALLSHMVLTEVYPHAALQGRTLQT